VKKLSDSIENIENDEKYEMTTFGKVLVTSLIWILLIVATYFIAIKPQLDANKIITPPEGTMLTEMKGDSLVFSVRFEANQTILTEDDYEILRNTAEFAKTNADFAVYIEAYAPNTTDANFDKTLSNSRADAAGEYLSYLGVDRAKIVRIGLATDSIDTSNRLYIYFRK
jgi:outer membrane protein OmpA-like peptidoglycan-associated protein